MSSDADGSEERTSKAVVARIPTPMTVTPLPSRLPTIGERAVELLRHPAVMLSAGAALTIAAEVGFRLLDSPAGRSSLTRRARSMRERPGGYVVKETLTVTRRFEISTPR